jgi:hypothetical protein
VGGRKWAKTGGWEKASRKVPYRRITAVIVNRKC